ncbi:Hypothetical protein, putative [Bodo saltans]|uniref:Uncharacterized protein n=1 Tax=Bodo saltans TaxID=75058 RepID=A0A0S4JDN8_BODSA|nr:Hypothetical protein, putative [Bodo saltans]|eukprot:CUG87100.1 Hypothetical protein, putative [Bodo saltans]
MKFRSGDAPLNSSVLGVIQQKLKAHASTDIAELLSALATDADVRSAEHTFSTAPTTPISFLGLSESNSHKTSKGNEGGFPDPPIDELFLLQRILNPVSSNNRNESTSTTTSQRSATATLLQKLEQCHTLDRLLDLAAQGISWYFQSAQGLQQRNQTNHSVMNGSSYLGSISHTQQPSTISAAPTHVPHTIGASTMEISLLRLTLVCDALFLFVHQSNVVARDEAENNDDTLLRRRTSSRLRSAGRASAEAIHVPPRTYSEWQRVATRLASIVMLTSDAQEDELAIRRIGLSLTAALSQVLQRCVDGSSDEIAFVPDMLYTQQIHRHCPTHFILMAAARSVLAAAHTHQRELRREHSAAAVDNSSGLVELDTTAAATGANTVRAQAVDNAQRLLQVLATSRAARCVLQDTLYIRTFGDPCGVYGLLTSTFLAPAVRSFVDAVSMDFWRHCDPVTLQSYTWALAELMNVVVDSDAAPKSGTALGDGGRMTMLTFLETEVFVSHDVASHQQTPASPNAPRLPNVSVNDHWVYLGAWLALQASLMLEPSTAMLSAEHAAIRTAMRLGSLHQQGVGVVEQLKRVTIRTLTAEHDISSPAVEHTDAASSSAWFCNPDLSHAGGPSSVDHDTALSMLLLVDAFLWTIEGQPSPNARRLLHDKVQEASQQHVHLSSIFQDIAHTALSVQTLQISSPPQLSNTPMALALRCIGRHYSLLSDNGTLPVLEYLVCDDVMRRLAATPLTAEAAVHPMLLTTALVSNSPADLFAGVVAPVIRTLSLGTMHQQSHLLPLATRALLANTWLRVVSHVSQGCLNEFTAAIRNESEAQQMLSLTILNEVANILVLSLYLDQQGVATLGTDPVRVVLIDCLQLLTALSAAGGNADVIVRHEMSWNGESLSLFHVILSLAFESNESDVVEAATGLVVDALENFHQCDVSRQSVATTVVDPVESIRPLQALRRATNSSLVTNNASQKSHIALHILSALAQDNQTAVAVPRLLILKAMIIYDTPLFDFLFPPPASVRPESTAKDPKPMSPVPSNNNSRTVLIKLLRDTLQVPADFSPRCRAEALELIRRMGPIHYPSAPSANPPPALKLMNVVEASRTTDAIIASSQAQLSSSTHQEEVPEAGVSVTSDFSADLLDNALLVSAAVRFAAQEMANAVVSHAGSSKASSGSNGEGGGSKMRVPPMSPLTTPLKDSPSSTTAQTRCPAVVNHAAHLDEVLRRAMSIVEAIIPVATTCMTACSAQLEQLAGSLYLGEDYLIRRVRLHYGDSFAFTSLTARAAPVCLAVNRLAAVLDVLTELSESVEALFLSVYRDYSSGAKLVELATSALCTFFALVPLTAPAHPSLGWYSGDVFEQNLTVCPPGLNDRTRWCLRPQSFDSAINSAELTTQFESVLLERDDAVGTLLIIGSTLADVLRTHHGNVITVKSLSIPTPVELMTRATQLRSSPSSSSNNGTAPSLTLEFLDCLMTGIAAYGGSTSPLQCFTMARCLWQALHSRLHTSTFFLSEATSSNGNTLILCRLLDVLTTLVLHGPDGTCLNLPVEELLQAVSLLGGHDAVALGGFTKDDKSASAVELGWYSVWRGFLTLLRGMVLRLPHDANEWLDCVVSCLSTSPRFQNALCGPQRPQAPAGLASAAAAADYEATVIVGELRETELAAQLLSCAVIASSSSSHQWRHSTRVFAAIQALVDYLCIGFAVLRKPNMIVFGGHDAVALGGFTKDDKSASAVELGWYSVWRGFLTLLRGMVLRLPHDANEWLDCVVSCLSTSPRFQNALCGPQRPQAPAGLASAAAAADYEATVIVGELRETELAAQLLSCAVIASSSSSHQWRHSTRVFAAIQTLVDYLCIGFAVLRKPNMIVSMVRRPTSAGSADYRREAELACASIVNDHLTVLSWWCAESEDWLLTDFQPVRRRGQSPSPPHAGLTFAEPSPLIGNSDWPAVGKSLFSLDALRDFLVSQFTAVKKIHRDAPFTPATSSAHPPSTPHLLSTSLSPSLRSAALQAAQLNSYDGAESVVDSEVSYSQPSDHPRCLYLHVQSIKVAVQLFLRAVQARSKAHVNSGATWTGPARDTSEKLEWNMKSIASDLRSYDNMQELSTFLEHGRLFLDGVLHRSVVHHGTAVEAAGASLRR